MSQQAPPSKLQAAILFSSSHHLSLAHWGDPQSELKVVVDVVVLLVVKLGEVVVVVVVVEVVLVVISKHWHTCWRYVLIHSGLFQLSVTVIENRTIHGPFMIQSSTSWFYLFYGRKIWLDGCIKNQIGPRLGCKNQILHEIAYSA